METNNFDMLSIFKVILNKRKFIYSIAASSAALYLSGCEKNPNTPLEVRNIVHPCTATSIMFAIGFSVLMGSEISLIVDLGILSASAIVFSWFAHFFFFPAVLRLFYPDKKK